MDKFEFYKELYFRENERRREVLNSLNIPIAIITALFSGMYLFVTSFDYQVEYFLTAIFIALISALGICLLLALYFLIRAFSDFTKGYEYSGIPYTKELYDWNKNLEDYYEEYEGSKKKAKKAFETFITENLVKHTEHNMYVNDKKHGYIYRSKKFLIIALVLSLITLVPFGYNYFNKESDTYRVEVVKLSCDNCCLDFNSNQTKCTSHFNINNNEQETTVKVEADTSTSSEATKGSVN